MHDKKKILIVMVTVLVWLAAVPSHALADSVKLSNGDTVSGTILSETQTHVMIQTEAMGTVKIDRNFLAAPNDSLSDQDKKEEIPSLWSRTVTFGYGQSGGNTEKSQFNGDLAVHRKTDHDEWIGQWNSYVTTVDSETDSQKYYGMLRYAYSFGRDLKWYHFTKFESNRDMFSNIDYRMIPSTGVGYWISDQEDYKLMFEAALGFEHTDYHDNTGDDNNVVIIPRGYWEKVIFRDARLKQDVVLYPSVEDVETYRFRTQTDLIHPITDNLSWRMSFIDDFDAGASDGTKKNDYRLISGVEVMF